MTTTKREKKKRMLHTISPIGKPTPRFTSSMTEDEAKSQSRLLQAIADPTRIRILNILMRHEGNVCVQEMVQCFSLSQPTLSHHLRILRDAGLVGYHKQRLYVYYKVHKDALIDAWHIIENLVELS